VLRRLAPKWRLLSALLLIVLAVLLEFGVAFFLTHSSGGTSIRTPRVSNPEVGLFVGGEDPATVQAVARQLRVKVTLMSVYAYGPDFTQFAEAPSTHLRLLLAVGEVNAQQARAIGKTLVSAGHANTVIRIMWEMNGDWFPWGTSHLTPSQYISRYRVAERAFAEVPGNHFTFVWNVNAGTVEPGRTEFDTYPGNRYVNNLGIDFYRFNRARGGGATESALAPIFKFAALHHLPTSLDEWGLDGAESPQFINYVSRVVHSRSDRVAFQVYFDYGLSDLSRYPLAARAFTKDFG